jgi:membrane protease YdiL (CAAX protease family)
MSSRDEESMMLPGSRKVEDDLPASSSLPEPASTENAEAPSEPGPVEEAQPEAWPPPRALWIETGVVLLVATVPHLFYSIWFHWLPDPQALPFAYMESAYFLESVALGALGLHFIWRSGEPREEFGIVRPSWWDIPGGLVVMAVVWTTYVQVLGPFLLHYFPDDPYSERLSLLIPRPQSPAEYGLLALSCAAVGFGEEVIYRAYLLPRLGRLTGSDGGGLLFGTVIFAVVHIYQGPAGVISAAWFGLVAGAVFLVIRRVWPLVFAHGLTNFVLIGWGE